jgi:hypothetical protein
MKQTSAALVMTLACSASLAIPAFAQIDMSQGPPPLQSRSYDQGNYNNPYQIPAGSTFIVRLDDTLDTSKNLNGKKFTAKLAEDLVTPNGQVIPRGKKIHGHISSAGGGFNGRMLLSFTEIETRHGWVPLIATVVSVPGEHGVNTDDKEGEIKKTVDKRRTVESAAAGAAIGATAGALGGGGKGAAIGAGAGAALGTTAGILTDRNLRLDKGTQLELRLDRPLTVPQS